ncbi:MAG: hypothetical protein WBB67_11785 [bacterium]
MNKKQIEQEYIKLKYEIFENKPKTNEPYPPDIVKRRILLLYAQVHLAEISWAKKCNDAETERLHMEAYNLVMSQYYE